MTEENTEKKCMKCKCRKSLTEFHFKVGSNSQVRDYCKACNTDPNLLINDIGEWKSKGTITQNSIAKLKAKYTHPDYVPTYTDCSWMKGRI